eukprot:6472-Heterococcus_DN1.PRE.1
MLSLQGTPSKLSTAGHSAPCCRSHFATTDLWCPPAERSISVSCAELAAGCTPCRYWATGSQPTVAAAIRTA